MKKFSELKNKFKDKDKEKTKGKDRDLDTAPDDPAAAESPDPGTDGKKSSISTKVTSFMYCAPNNNNNR